MRLRKQCVYKLFELIMFMNRNSMKFHVVLFHFALIYVANVASLAVK